eukprot:14641411-Alexandrium_andersonii.AAC.1
MVGLDDLADFRSGQAKTIRIHQTAKVFDDHEHPGITFPAYRGDTVLPPPREVKAADGDASMGGDGADEVGADVGRPEGS